MDIQTAIKSGKPFRRKEWSNGAWYTVGNGLRYHTEDVLADDWIIQDRSITITESQFDEVWEQLLNAHESYCLIKNFKKRLGF